MAVSKKHKVKKIIRMDVRSLADLKEFPNMDDCIMPIKIITNNVFDSVEDARDYCYDNYAKWGRNYNVMVAFRDRLSVKETKKIKYLKNRIDMEEKRKLIISTVIQLIPLNQSLLDVIIVVLKLIKSI